MAGNQIDLTQLRRGTLEYCVLALLEDEPRYGYDLVTQLCDAGMVTSEGTVYPLLSRLRRDHLVDTTWQESASGPPRRYYSLTVEGSAALAAFRTSWCNFKTSVDSITNRKSYDDNH
ncbi:MAG: PadR family transcriptional regulator [Propionibacteriaceae bacterium]